MMNNTNAMLRLSRLATWSIRKGAGRCSSSAAISAKARNLPAEKAPDHPLSDKHGRFHNYLRISLVEKCNLKCKYCVPDEDVQYSEKSKLLSAKEIGRLASIFVGLGVNKIRLTGGEPTIRSDLDAIIGNINKLRPMGLDEIGLTTNGIVLSRKLPSYKKAGLDSMNISLDTLLPDKYTYITGLKGLNVVLKGIFSALSSGIKPVKLNVVIMADVNENEMENFVELTRHHPLDVRFLEFMPFDGNKWSRNKMVPYEVMLKRIYNSYPKLESVKTSPHDTARSFQVPGYAGRIGFITSMTNNFCGGCNRLRITADGHLKACLFGTNEVNLRESLRGGASDAQLTSLISTAVKRKAPKHGGMDLLQKMKNRPMILIDEYIENVFQLLMMPSFTRFSKISTHRYYSIHKRTHRFLNHHLFLADYAIMPSAKFSTSSVSCSSPELVDVGAIKMATVSGKKPTRRSARAVATVRLPETTMKMIIEGRLPKVDSLTALCAAIQIAGVNAAKRTPDLLMLCHPIPISVVDVTVGLQEATSSFIIETCVIADNAVTGVEMEALVAASTAALTLYDIAKSAGSQNIVVSNVRLLEKRGGKSDYMSS